MGAKLSNPTDSCVCENAFLPIEKDELNEIFDSLCTAECREENVDKFQLADLQKYIGQKLPSHMTERLFNIMKSNSVEHSSVDRTGFLKTLAYIIKGSTIQQSHIFYQLSTTHSQYVDASEILKFVEDVVACYQKVVLETPELSKVKIDTSMTSVKSLCLHLLSQLRSSDGKSLTSDETGEVESLKFTVDNVESWMKATHLIHSIMNSVFLSCFPIVHWQIEVNNTSQCMIPTASVPTLHVEAPNVIESLLSVPSILVLNDSLPLDMRKEWTLLFSSNRDGESFTSLVNCILDEGPTLILLKDKLGHVFGGFASESWELNPNFRGTSSSFLYKVSPVMGIYSATCYNDHYMYLNSHQQTLPNGLGMGGQLEYFGLWIDSNFGRGKCSPSCTTYGSPLLSGSENFEIHQMEIWRVGPKPVKIDEDEDQASILDIDPEAKAMLMLVNKGPYSEGLREHDMTADSPDEKILRPLL